MRLFVSIEKAGTHTIVGTLCGSSEYDTVFSYEKEYLASSDAAPISVNMPIREEPFPPQATKAFFEGLLPEGFTRRTVAGWLHIPGENYLMLLQALGSECLGAIRVFSDAEKDDQPGYRLISLEELKALAKEGAAKSSELVIKSHLSLAGASGKTGMMLHDGNWYQPLGTAPSTHIVKQSHVRLSSIVLNEYLCLKTAQKLGIRTSNCSVINLKNGEDDSVLFVSERFDRAGSDNSPLIDGIPKPLRLHQEDFAQALGIPSSEKYEADGGRYLNKMISVIRNHSANPIDDIQELWKSVVFDWLIGNNDSHIKNHGLLYANNLKSMRLAPAYDMVSTCIYEQSSDRMSYSINGKYSLKDIGLTDFKKEAAACSLNPVFAERIFDQITSEFTEALQNSAEEIAGEGLPETISIAERIRSIRNI